MLIKHVLQSLPLYTFAAMIPPKTIIARVERIIARFFWGSDEKEVKYHWVKWSACCKPIKEGGIGLRNFGDICHAFVMKNWWLVRVSQSIWAKFMKQKYAPNKHLSECVVTSSCSAVWRKMVAIKEEAEQYINWSIGEGKIKFWSDNWLGSGKISQLVPIPSHHKDMTVRDFLLGSEDFMQLVEGLPSHMVQ